MVMIWPLAVTHKQPSSGYIQMSSPNSVPNGSQATASQIPLAQSAGHMSEFCAGTAGWQTWPLQTPTSTALTSGYTISPPPPDSHAVSPGVISMSHHASASTGHMSASAANMEHSSCNTNLWQQQKALLHHTPQPRTPAVVTGPQHAQVPCTDPLAVGPYPQCSVPFALEQQLQQQQQQQQLHQTPECTLFFAGVSPFATPEELLKVFAQFGRVMNINLYRPYRGCKTSKGCGLVEYAQHSEAAAAMEALAGRYVWRGAHGPMAVEWYREMPPAAAKKPQATWPGAQGLVRVSSGCTPASFVPTAAGQSTAAGQFTAAGQPTAAGQSVAAGQCTAAGPFTAASQFAAAGQFTAAGPLRAAGLVTTAAGQFAAAGQFTAAGHFTLAGQPTPAGQFTAAGQPFQMSTADRRMQELPAVLPSMLWGL